MTKATPNIATQPLHDSKNIYNSSALLHTFTRHWEIDSAMNLGMAGLVADLKSTLW